MRMFDVRRGALRSSWVVIVLATACSSSGGGAAPSSGCKRDTQCPTYVCTCNDGVSIQLHSCLDDGTCASFPGVCDSCASHGGAKGSSSVLPPSEPLPGSDGGPGDDGSIDDCATFTAATGCYLPLTVTQGTLATEGSVCDPATLHTCGESCPGDPHTSTGCCPLDKECSVDEDGLVPKCGASGDLDGVTYLCVPKNVHRCFLSRKERQAADLPEWTDYACVQHDPGKQLFGCDTHLKSAHCVSGIADDPVFLPTCPAEAASCKPTSF